MRSTKAPSFRGYRPSSAKASRTLSGRKSEDTSCEKLLRRALWRKGLRFRKNDAELPGKPDIVFPGPRVVVFCDGDFWHGRDWAARRRKLQQGANAEYWVRKIRSNVERDRKRGRELKKLGWHVIRIWETDITSDPDQVAAELARIVQSKRGKASPGCS